LTKNPTIAHLNEQYGIIDTLQTKLQLWIKDGKFVLTAFGGIVGVGKSVLSGAFSALTIIVLTLYFLSSLPQITKIAYRLAPASRRDRIANISDAIISRIGTFVGSQVSISALAAVVMFIVGEILRIPYATSIAMVVFVAALIPLVGHFIAGSIFTIVATAQTPTTGLIAFIVYVLYVQIENYIIAPRIMKRSLSIPGIVTIVSALIGTSLLGLVGGLLAVPVAAAVILILEEVVFPRAEKS
jgi:predicted PurR-regulated permease PerM